MLTDPLHSWVETRTQASPFIIRHCISWETKHFDLQNDLTGLVGVGGACSCLGKTIIWKPGEEPADWSTGYIGSSSKPEMSLLYILFIPFWFLGFAALHLTKVHTYLAMDGSYCCDFFLSLPGIQVPAQSSPRRTQLAPPMWFQARGKVYSWLLAMDRSSMLRCHIALDNSCWGACLGKAPRNTWLVAVWCWTRRTFFVPIQHSLSYVLLTGVRETMVEGMTMLQRGMLHWVAFCLIQCGFQSMTAIKIGTQGHRRTW